MMFSVIIPSLAISGAVIMGNSFSGDNVKHQKQATEILDAGYVYGYRDYFAFGGHDTGVFAGLWNIKKNALVIVDNKRYRVSHTALVDPTDTEILLHKAIFTCRNNNRKRFVVFLK